MTSRAFTLLLVEPDNESAAGVDAALRASGIACRRVADAESGWREFARARPDAVLTAWETPKRGGAWLVRRVHDDYLGALPPIYGIFHPEELRGGARAEELDAAFVRPLRPALIAPLLTAPTAEEQPEISATRLRDLFELSLLTGDLEEAVRRVLDRARRAFRAEDLMLATTDRFWRLGQGVGPDPLAELAVLAGTTLVDGATTGRSLLAAPLLGSGGEQVGLICLENSGARRYSAEELAALRSLGRRLGTEMTWRAAQRRLAAEVGRLQETAKVDPLLGIMTRTALVDAVAEIRARGASFALLVVDVIELKQVNERHGHVAGDAALGRITQQLKAELPHGATIGRLAGDELAVFLPGVPAADAQKLAETMVRVVSATPVVHLGVAIPVAIRVGGTLCPAEVGAASEPLALAEAALLQAKRRRASVFFHEPGTPMPSGTVEEQPRLGALATGVTLGGMYQIRHEISRGAMGVVYRAEDLGLRRPVALKVLRADLASDVELVERFRNEAALLASVRHDNLVAVHSFGTQGDVVFFVMELVEGESLAEMLRRADDAGEAIAPQVIADAVSQVADALTAMHSAGVVHRDVKPANVLIDRARHRAVLVDVGVARRAGLGSEEAVGTPGFAAPESFTRSGEGPQVDVYGLAATAYMMLTNLAPFGGGEAAKVVRRQIGEKPAPPTLLRRDLSSAVDDVFARALSAHPQARPQSAHELAAALGAALAQPATPRSIPAASGSIDVELFETEERQLRALRGAVFRHAYRVLGNKLGSGWIKDAIGLDPALLQVVGPQVAPREWIPVDLFPPLVRGASGGRDPVKLAREIGRVAASGPFGRYDGEGIDLPEQLLAQPRRFWSRYASWGKLEAELGPAHATVKMADGPRDAVVCGLIEGLLERLTELAGGVDARAWHVSCRARGDAECVFELRWTAPTALRQ